MKQHETFQKLDENTLKALAKPGEVFYCKKDVNGLSAEDTYRAYIESDSTIFLFAKGKHRYGYRLSFEHFTKYYRVRIIDKNAEWHKRIDRVLKALNKSGLWSDIKEVFENLQTITYEEKQAIAEEYSSFSYHDEKNEEYSAFIEKVKAKYPFMVFKNKKGEDCIDTDYLYEISEAIVKNMYFGKWENKTAKENIKAALEGKTRHTERARTGYDVSFEYNPELNNAWYSEEYKDCGNGHYYLALDETLALFCEND